MGKIYARLIHDYERYGIDTSYHSIADVPNKYKAATRTAYEALFGVPAPEE